MVWSIVFVVACSTVVTSGCSAGPASTSAGSATRVPSPGELVAERDINLGFESIVGSPDFDSLDGRLSDVGATGVSIAIGRTDWLAFRWDAHPEAWSDDVAETGTDYVADAISALAGSAAGSASRTRSVTLTIDALAPRWIETAPELAGVDERGNHSPEFMSVSALEGTFGDRLVELVAVAAERYRPDAIALTELMFDDHTFGDADLALFRAYSGLDDWPRSGDGSIDTTDTHVTSWRCSVIAGLVSRARTAASEFGVRLDMDVRAPLDDPAADRRDSGHDYDMLLDAADRLVVWDYPGIDSHDSEFSARMVAALAQRGEGRFVVSVGVWSETGTIRGDRLEEALSAVSRSRGIAGVSVTPASLLSDAHWDAITEVWQN